MTEEALFTFMVMCGVDLSHCKKYFKHGRGRFSTAVGVDVRLLQADGGYEPRDVLADVVRDAAFHRNRYESRRRCHRHRRYTRK